ncbi:glycosaminoglycan xylosylkinase-like isoform X2 [Dysidea avara]
MKQLGIEEVVENKFDNNAPVKETLDSPKVMYKKKTSHNNVVTSKGLSVDAAWQVWRSWPHTKQLYEEQYFSSNQMADILHHMATAPIINYDVGHRGTQLKALATLQGDQLAVFKPKRYERDYVVPGEPYAGFDMHTAEIVGFYLDGLLGFRLAPPVVGRVIDLTALKSVTSQKLLDTYFMQGDNMCFYGVCYYCKPAEAACADGTKMEGSLTLWLPVHMSLRNWRHPYQRTYRDGHSARWEVNEDYCKNEVMLKVPYNNGPRLLDIMDTTVLDYLMGNADRHHYETFDADGNNGRLLHLDNGKSFRDPSKDESSILAPLRQCCRLRNSTWRILQSLQEDGLSGKLDKLLHNDPLYPILTQAHLESLDRRHHTLLDVVNECIKQLGAPSVIINDIE